MHTPFFPAKTLFTKKIICPILFLFGTLICSINSNAQNLTDFQKLRGAPLSSAAIPYSMKAWGEGDGPTYHIAHSAFDTNKDTFFKSEAKGGWVGLDLGAAYTIKKVRVYPRADRTIRMKNAVIEGADNADFNNAVALYTIANEPSADVFTTYDTSNTTAFRYVRCRASSDYECNLAELEFYADLESQPSSYPQLSNLPTIYLETKGHFDFVDKSKYAKTVIVISEGGKLKYYPGEVKGRGNSTWWFMEKKPIRIKFEKKQQFLGLPANAKSWTLLSNYVDKTFVRNGMAFEMARILGFEWSPTCTYADVVLDGFYYGTFMVADQVQINEDRINIPEMTATDISGDNLTGGYHLEIDAYANKEPVYFHSSRGVPFTVKNPDDPCMPEQLKYITDHINLVEKTLFENPTEAFEKYIDLPSAVKYYLISELTANIDSYWCIPCYKKRGDDKLYFGPVWDYDQAFFTGYRIAERNHVLTTGHGAAKNWFTQIMATPEARAQLKIEWKNAEKQNLLDVLMDYADEYSELLQQSAALNYERWPALGDKVWWFNGHTFPTFQEYVDFMKEKTTDRYNWYADEVKELIVNNDYHHFLMASKPSNPKTTWKYMLRESSVDYWYKEEYIDNHWDEAPAPFGTANGYSTEWRTPQNELNTILLRTHFEVDEKDLLCVKELFLTVFHDEDVWIYINDELAFERTGYNNTWEDFPLDKRFLKAGENLIAVRCDQQVGGQMIDVGIYATLHNSYEETMEDDIVTYFPISDKETFKKLWKYSTTAPADTWYKEDFDDTSWTYGFAPFGSKAETCNTTWTGLNSFYLRTTFEASDEYVDQLAKGILTIRHDESCVVYLNGQLVLEGNEALSEYSEKEIVNHIKEGSNTLAVMTKNEWSGQFFDLGLSAKLKEPVPPCDECDDCELCPDCPQCQPDPCDECDNCDECPDCPQCQTDPCDECSDCTLCPDCPQCEETGLDATKNKVYASTVCKGRAYIYNVEDGLTIRLYNLNGQLINQTVANGSAVEIALPAKGIYLAKIQDKVLRIVY